MQGALRQLLEGVIDYAGLFPPAKLPMADAVAEYLALEQGPKAWIVDRFVCSAGRLPELLTELADHSPDEVSGRQPVRVSVVGTASSDHKHWHSGLEHDFAAIQAFRKAAERRAEVEAYEIRIPDHQHLSEYLRNLAPVKDLEVFIELPWAQEMADSLAILAETEAFGAKARTGGLDASAIPSSADLASFIQSCVHLDLTFKCTAGLHQPLRHFDEGLGTDMHGFLNVLLATVFADTEDLSRREIEELLDEKQAQAFDIKDQTIGWGGHTATMDQIADARQLFVGFGSCSVEEPLEGLQAWTKAAAR